MTEPTLKERQLTLTELSLLQAGGVDSWSGYSHAAELYTPTGDEYEDAASLLEALDSAGVDNWEWYSESLQGFAAYAGYLEEAEDDSFLSFDEWSARSSDPEVESAVVSPVFEVTTPNDEVGFELHRLLKTRFPQQNSATLFAAVVDGGLWQRAVFPKEFDVALKKARIETGPFLANARMILLTQVEKNGKLYEFAEQFI